MPEPQGVGLNNLNSASNLPLTGAPLSGVFTSVLTPIVATFLASRIAPGARLCVALSGGRDSLVLLHALRHLAWPEATRFKLSALHVHHGLSAQADAWAEFCVDFCQRYEVPLKVVHVEVPRASGEGLEAAARRLRHGAFAECAADWLALAHHRDDQAETVLLNLLRGAGIAGAAGMLAERSQPLGPTLIRPLLDVPRSAIDHYATQHALTWIDDESNDNVHFRRNYLRHNVMPGVVEKFPGAALALARAAGHFAEGAALLDDLAAIDRAALETSEGRIALDRFNALPCARARNLLRCAWVTAGFRAPDARWIDEALRQLANAASASEICVATPEGELHVYRGELYIVARRMPMPEATLAWSGEPELPWAGGRVRFVPSIGTGVQRDRLAGAAVRLECRHGGERLQPDPRRPRRTLRNLLQEGGIPPWARDRLPCLWCAARLVWVGGLGIEADFACAPGEAGLQLIWEPN